MNRVLRIFGLKTDEVTSGWKKLHNEGLRDLYSSPSMVRIITSIPGKGQLIVPYSILSKRALDPQWTLWYFPGESTGRGLPLITHLYLMSRSLLHVFRDNFYT
jgi:hypothetical protein